MNLSWNPKQIKIYAVLIALGVFLLLGAYVQFPIELWAIPFVLAVIGFFLKLDSKPRRFIFIAAWLVSLTYAVWISYAITQKNQSPDEPSPKNILSQPEPPLSSQGPGLPAPLPPKPEGPLSKAITEIDERIQILEEKNQGLQAERDQLRQENETLKRELGETTKKVQQIKQLAEEL